MSVFEPIRLTWAGTEYVIPADKVMRAIALVEDHVTLTALSIWQTDREKIRLTRLASAYGAALRYAGAKVADEEVYAGLFNTEEQTTIYGALQGMLMMMIPPAQLAEPSDGKKKPPAGRKKSGS